MRSGYASGNTYIKFPPELRAWLHAKAEAEHREFKAQVVYMLEQLKAQEDKQHEGE